MNKRRASMNNDRALDGVHNRRIVEGVLPVIANCTKET